MFFNKTHRTLSVVIDNETRYERWNDVKMKIEKSGALKMVGFPEDSEEKKTYIYAPGTWKKVFSW